MKAAFYDNLINMKFSIVIPCIPKHHKYLPKLVKFLVLNGSEIGEILIVTSSTDEDTIQKLRTDLVYGDSGIEIVVIGTLSEKTAGENRNSGWNAASGEYVMFLDADDWYANSRTHIISEAIKSSNADFVLHNYWKFKPKWFLENDILFNSDTWLKSKDLIASTWEGKARNTDLERGLNGDTNVIARDKEGNSWPIQHGHVTIRKSVNIRFSKEYGEDGRIIRDALENGFEVLYLPNKLSIYNQISFNFAIRSVFRYLKGLLL